MVKRRRIGAKRRQDFTRGFSICFESEECGVFRCAELEFELAVIGEKSAGLLEGQRLEALSEVAGFFQREGQLEFSGGVVFGDQRTTDIQVADLILAVVSRLTDILRKRSDETRLGGAPIKAESRQGILGGVVESVAIGVEICADSETGELDDEGGIIRVVAGDEQMRSAIAASGRGEGNGQRGIRARCQSGCREPIGSELGGMSPIF